MKAIPTLLTTSDYEFMSQMELFQKYYHRIQLDIADGILVSNKTTQIQNIEAMLHDKEISLSPQTLVDFHLMVEDYQRELPKIERLQAMGMQVHLVLINATRQPDIDELYGLYNFSIGLDVFPSVQINTIARHYNLKKIGHIQIMTVEPGFQGSPFLPQMLYKIQQLRQQDYTGEILIDGGVNHATLPVILQAPSVPDIVCIGSYLTKSGADLAYRVNELKKFE